MRRSGRREGRRAGVARLLLRRADRPPGERASPSTGTNVTRPSAAPGVRLPSDVLEILDAEASEPRRYLESRELGRIYNPSRMINPPAVNCRTGSQPKPPPGVSSTTETRTSNTPRPMARPARTRRISYSRRPPGLGSRPRSPSMCDAVAISSLHDSPYSGSESYAAGGSAVK